MVGVADLLGVWIVLGLAAVGGGFSVWLAAGRMADGLRSTAKELQDVRWGGVISGLVELVWDAREATQIDDEDAEVDPQAEIIAEMENNTDRSNVDELREKIEAFDEPITMYKGVRTYFTRAAILLILLGVTAIIIGAYPELSSSGEPLTGIGATVLENTVLGIGLFAGYYFLLGVLQHHELQGLIDEYEFR